MRTRAFGVFRRIVWKHYRTHGRALPWRPPGLKLRKDETLNPYKILVSEIMLQQTQTERVERKYGEFLKQFPTLKALCRSPVSGVLKAWQGLGYNRRALALKRCADVILDQHRGKIPANPEILDALPGVGQSTAGAVAAFAFNRPAVFIETNIRRAFLFHFFRNKRKVSDQEIRTYVEQALPAGRQAREWYYALMDYGTHLARSLPKHANPNRRSRQYVKQSKFEGSHRQIRGAILRVLTNGPVAISQLKKEFPEFSSRIPKAVLELQKEGFVISRGSRVSLER